jgi:murein DD-endopeptidase MepM/ murein hydrolase activator NlpD
MALPLIDRVLTIVVTATLTSAAWIVFGSVYLDDPEAGTTSPESSPERKSAAVADEQQPVPAGPDSTGVAGGLAIPVAGVSASQLSDTFDDARGGGERAHEALDIMAPAGTAVLAAGPGTIEKLFRSDAGGKTIYVRSADRRMIHYYAHLQDYASGLKEGRQVSRGQRLGTVGSTGNADPAAPHLHFAILRTTPDAEWWEPATALNPFPLLDGTPAQIAR